MRDNETFGALSKNFQYQHETKEAGTKRDRPPRTKENRFDQMMKQGDGA